MTDHPITPSPELQEEWLGLWPQDALLQAAGWGWQQRDASVPGELQKARDEELEACCEWLEKGFIPSHISNELRTARRPKPKPKSLAEEALEAQQRMWNGARDRPGDWDLVYRALERLQQLEEQGDD